MTLTVRIAMAEPFQRWTGGACPVADNCRVEVTHRSGAKSRGRASEFAWDHIGCISDIIEWRVA